MASSPNAYRKIGHPSPRSRLTNHKDILPNVRDGRSGAARRFRDLVRSYITDLGGLDNISEVKLGLLRRLAGVTVQSETLEAMMVNGQLIPVAELCMLASTAVRISQRLGLSRVARDVTPLPNVAAYIEHVRQQQEAGDDEAAS
jgi:hypothetical protein